MTLLIVKKLFFNKFLLKNSVVFFKWLNETVSQKSKPFLIYNQVPFGMTFFFLSRHCEPPSIPITIGRSNLCFPWREIASFLPLTYLHILLKTNELKIEFFSFFCQVSELLFLLFLLIKCNSSFNIFKSVFI